MDLDSVDNWEFLFSELARTELGLKDVISSCDGSDICTKNSKNYYKPDAWRGIHNLLSKNSKIVEKAYSGYNFELNSSPATLQSSWKDAISETLVREGFPLTDFNPEFHKQGKDYTQLSSFVLGFDQNILSIFDWIKVNFPESFEKEALLAEFIQYLFFEFLQKNDLKAALILIKDQINYFKHTENQKAIKKLLSIPLYYATKGFPKREQLGAEALKDHFIRSYCKYQKIPKIDPIYACNEIGTKSIPPLDRLSSLLKGKDYTKLSAEDELPIELTVEEEFVFHSIFCCPVIKQQSSEDNPAFLLPCNHALSKEALNRLSKGNPLVRFKCPYCPTEANYSNCLQLNF